MRTLIPIMSVLFAAAFVQKNVEALDEHNSVIGVSAGAEMGFLRALHHDIQIGQEGYRLDYVTEGGQEILLPFYRFEVFADIRDRHELIFLYQPLTLQTKTRVDNAGGIAIDDIVFADNTPLDLQYGFNFYRLTYRYALAFNDKWRFSLGGALQLRNASIIFEGYDEDRNDIRAISQDLGPVAVFSFAGRRTFTSGLFVDSTLDAFYAPIRYLNLRDADVVGWIYDFAIRLGTPVADNKEAYLSTRFLGGGADGTAKERKFWTQSRVQPRYTWNNINLVIISLGLRF